jgi:ATP-dependent RNA helicase DDX56/DBP9
VDKFLLTYVMLKLKLIKGKCILFVNDVDRCYRLKLFLEQFSIKSCVLNAELPLNSRVHIVQEFNKGVYDYIIATDESAGKGDDHPKPDDTDERDEPGELTVSRAAIVLSNIVLAAERAEDDEQEPYPDSPSKKRKRDSPPPISSSKKKKRKGKDKEYGVTRGIDFIDVSCVVNFDLPTTSRGYTHRVGRTARAGRKGMALSFVVPRQEYKKNKVVGGVPSTERDEETWQQILDEQRMRGASIVDYNFDKEKVEAFRYRMEDALRTVTRAAIKEGKLKDLKNEVLKSDKLKVSPISITLRAVVERK